MRTGILTVSRVQEQDAGLAIPVRAFHDRLEDRARVRRPPYAAILRVDKVDGRFVLDGLHEGIRHADRYVEVGDRVLVTLAVDELEHIGMVDAKDGHIGATTRPTLADDLRGSVKYAHEADRSRRLATAAAYHGTLRPQPREGEARPTTSLLNKGCVAQCLEDAIVGPAHIIRNRQYETRGQLTQRRAGAGEGRRIGQEEEVGEHPVEERGRRDSILTPLLFSARDMRADAPKHIGHRLHGLPVRTLSQVATLEHRLGVLSQLDVWRHPVDWRGNCELSHLRHLASVLEPKAAYDCSPNSRLISPRTASRSSRPKYTIAYRM